MISSLPFDFYYIPKVRVVTEDQLARERRHVLQQEINRLKLVRRDYRRSYKSISKALKERIAELDSKLQTLTSQEQLTDD